MRGIVIASASAVALFAEGRALADDRAPAEAPAPAPAEEPAPTDGEPPADGEPPTEPPIEHNAPIDIDVSGKRRTVTAVPLTQRETRSLPGAFGDAFRAIEILPGVTPVASGVPYFF